METIYDEWTIVPNPHNTSYLNNPPIGKKILLPNIQEDYFTPKNEEPEEEIPLTENEFEIILKENHFLKPEPHEEAVLVPTDMEIRIEKAIECIKELCSVDNKAQIKILALFLIYLMTSSVISCCTWNNKFINGIFFWLYITYICYSYEFREKIFNLVDIGLNIYEYGRQTYNYVHQTV